ncbi:MAG: acetate--CoA ligase family protein [Rickettsiales bacterium]|jgi:acetyltransferase|nr:acetate--CoA ligase family protein [Rickettsiales bacterium]
MGRNSIGNGAPSALGAFMHPKSVAVVGASNTPGKAGNAVMANMMEAGFTGAVYPINPGSAAVLGVPCFKSVSSLPAAPDLGVVAVPAAGVPDIIEEFGKKGTRAVTVISAGFSDKAPDGKTYGEHMMEKARRHKVRIIGPNCIGIQSPHGGVNASFMCAMAAKGSVGLVSQSGALATAAVDWAKSNGIGFSHIFSIGDAVDVDIADLLEYLADEESCASIVIYRESVKDPEKFIRAAQKAAARKPVFCLKSGRSAAAQKAASSHTGALASNDEFYEAMLRRAGVKRVENIEYAFMCASFAGQGFGLKSDRLTVLTNGGGQGILSVDRLNARGRQLAELAPATIAKLDAAMPSGWSHGNPVDIIGDAPASRYVSALEILERAPEVDAVLTILCPTRVISPLNVAEGIAASIGKNKFGDVFFAWTGGGYTRAGFDYLKAEGLGAFESPETAVDAFAGLLDARDIAKNLRAGVLPLDRTKAKKEKGYAAAKKIIDAAARKGRDTLTEAEAKEIFGLYGIPTVATYVAKDAKAAGEFAVENIKGSKVAIKIASEEISHKSDVGGVMLWIEPKDVERSCEAMLKTVRANVGDRVKIQGFAVQEMIDKSEMLELLVGTIRDKVFGPVLMFGSGGKSVEVEKDSACELIPLDEKLAIEAAGRTRIYRKLKGYRDVKPVDMKQLAKIMTSVSNMMLDFPEMLSLDVNPLLADGKRIVAVDARIILSLKK